MKDKIAESNLPKEVEKSKLCTFILQRRGTGFGLLIGSLSSIQQVMGKELTYAYGLGQILFTRFIFQAFFSIVFILITGKSFRSKTRSETIYLIFEVVFFNLGIVFMYFAFQDMHFPDVSAILYGTMTVAVIIIGRIVLKELVSCTTIILSFLMIVGVMFTSQPTFIFRNLSDNLDSGASLVGSLLALASGISFGISYVICRKIQLTQTATIAFYLSAGGVLFGAVMLGCSMSFKVPTNGMDIALVVCSGFVGFLNMTMLSNGFQIGNVTEVALATQIDVPLNYVCGFVFMHVTPDWLSIAGAFEIFICIAILLVKDNLFSCYVTTCKKYQEIPSSDEILKENV